MDTLAIYKTVEKTQEQQLEGGMTMNAVITL
jgi:hypothetical protein